MRTWKCGNMGTWRCSGSESESGSWIYLIRGYKDIMVQGYMILVFLEVPAKEYM